MLRNGVCSGSLLGRALLCALTVAVVVGLCPADDKPEPASSANIEELIDRMLEKYLAEGADINDPVAQALRWRRQPEFVIRILADPTQSYFLDPQFTYKPLPMPILPHDPWLTVPPEVMEDYYRRFVLEAKEPVYVTLKQEMIFSLRRRPKFCADFVRFDFDLENLSQVQLEVLGNWARAGHNRIMLMGEEIGKFAEFLGARRAFFNADSNRDPRPLVLACDHRVATDSRRLAVAFDWRENLLSRRYFWEGITATQTPNVDVIAFYQDETNMRVLTEDDETAEDELVAAFGRFKCGVNDVYFRPYYLTEGPDGERFELNWMMWIQGVEPTPPASPVVASAEAPADGTVPQPGEELGPEVLRREPGTSTYEEPYPVGILRPVTEAPDDAEPGRDDQPEPAEPDPYGPENIGHRERTDVTTVETEERVELIPGGIEVPYTQGLPPRDPELEYEGRGVLPDFADEEIDTDVEEAVEDLDAIETDAGDEEVDEELEAVDTDAADEGHAG